MFDSYGTPILRTDALGTVRDAAGFDTGYRVNQFTSWSAPTRLYETGGFDTGYTLRNERLYDRYNQPTRSTIEPYQPWKLNDRYSQSTLKPIEPFLPWNR